MLQQPPKIALQKNIVLQKMHALFTNSLFQVHGLHIDLQVNNLGNNCYL